MDCMKTPGGLDMSACRGLPAPDVYQSRVRFAGHDHILTACE